MYNITSNKAFTIQNQFFSIQRTSNSIPSPTKENNGKNYPILQIKHFFLYLNVLDL